MSTKTVYTDLCDGVMIMFMQDETDDSWEVYYKIAGWQYIYGFGLPGSYTYDTVKWIADVNAANYAEDLFHD